MNTCEPLCVISSGASLEEIELVRAHMNDIHVRAVYTRVYMSRVLDSSTFWTAVSLQLLLQSAPGLAAIVVMHMPHSDEQNVRRTTHQTQHQNSAAHRPAL